MTFGNGLPMIPGMSFGDELLRTNFRKTQMLTRNEPPENMANKSQMDTMTVQGSVRGDGEKQVSLDRKVLRFSCYFREGVHESALERERIRRCTLYYFLEDDTIAVTEPKQDNSGIQGQGAFIKRHQIPRQEVGAANGNAGAGSGIYTFDDFRTGQDVYIYGKCFHLCACDPFTRSFYSHLGIDVGEDEHQPEDIYGESRRPRKQTKSSNGDGDFLGTTQRTTISKQEILKTQQFLGHDKEVLRFHCFYDDRKALYGDVHLFTLHYFLADDTMEITEINPPNSGRDPFPTFVKRSKVPKTGLDEAYQNPNANMLFESKKVQYLTHEDLMIGKTLNIFGRKFLIYDVDEFTKQFLNTTYGVTDFTPISVAQAGPTKVTVQPPPHNGFGDEEDSLGSWKYLAVKPIKKDMRHKLEFADKSLKFQVKFAQAVDPASAIRKFVLTLAMADNTISIFEPAQRNSGIIGGKFLNKQKVKKVSANGRQTAEYLGPSDLWVGGIVNVNGHQFRVTSTDNKTMEIMEAMPEVFPKANVPLSLTQLRHALQAPDALEQSFRETWPEDEQLSQVDFESYKSFMESLGLPICEQEVLCIGRYFAVETQEGRGPVSVNVLEMLKVVSGK